MLNQDGRLGRGQVHRLGHQQPLRLDTPLRHAAAQFLVEDPLVQRMLIDDHHAVARLGDQIAVVHLDRLPHRLEELARVSGRIRRDGHLLGLRRRGRAASSRSCPGDFVGLDCAGGRCCCLSGLFRRKARGGQRADFIVIRRRELIERCAGPARAGQRQRLRPGPGAG